MNDPAQNSGARRRLVLKTKSYVVSSVIISVLTTSCGFLFSTDGETRGMFSVDKRNRGYQHDRALVAPFAPERGGERPEILNEWASNRKEFVLYFPKHSKAYVLGFFENKYIGSEYQGGDICAWSSFMGEYLMLGDVGVQATPRRYFDADTMVLSVLWMKGSGAAHFMGLGYLKQITFTRGPTLYPPMKMELYAVDSELVYDLIQGHIKYNTKANFGREMNCLDLGDALLKSHNASPDLIRLGRFLKYRLNLSMNGTRQAQ